ncbi:MAG: hypothetical protein IPN18_01085 [Ignavibacteriales bacterium]|nr:hypothetical protein [Ignavibacteriales bacterium]
MGLASSELITAGWILIAVYVAVTLFFVIRGALKSKDHERLCSGNVNFPPWTVGFALAASMTSAATFVINPGLVATYGISAFISYGLVYPAAAMISLVVLTIGFRKFGSSVKAGTLAQWMGKKYESKGFALYFAILSLLLLTFYCPYSCWINESDIQNPGCSRVVCFDCHNSFYFWLHDVWWSQFDGLHQHRAGHYHVVCGFYHDRFGICLFPGWGHGIYRQTWLNRWKTDSTLQRIKFSFSRLFEIFIAQIVIGAAIVCQPHIITKSLLIKDPKGS